MSDWKPAPRRPAVLRFSPTAWAKLLFLRDAGETEIGGFGIAAKDDLLFVQDIELVAQTCTPVHVALEDDSVADLFERQVAAGRQPEEFARIWIHTHPGKSAQPSSTDDITFARVFGRSDWAVMFILARGGQTYARLRYNIGPGSEMLLPVEIEYRFSFEGSNAAAWRAEYTENVRVAVSNFLKPPLSVVSKITRADARDSDHGWDNAWDEDFKYNPEETEYGFVRDF